MVQMQDSSDPTGVTKDFDPEKTIKEQDTSNLERARNRKANAAVQMRLAGATYEEVAQAVGYPTARAALVATEKALERQLQSSEDRDQMRRMAGQRMERLLRGVWPKAIDPNSPEQLAAVAAAKGIIDRHAKLFGLDAPSEVIVHAPTASELEDWVARVVSKGTPPVEEFDIIAGEVVEDVETVDWTEEDLALPSGS